METRSVYCSACDRDVHILVQGSEEHDPQAPIHDPEVVCLDIDVRCTGGMCPTGAVSVSAMKARRVRAGIGMAARPLIQATCPDCDRVTSHHVVDDDHVMCADCGGMMETRLLALALGREG
jgi:hypothetical protein